MRTAKRPTGPYLAALAAALLAAPLAASDQGGADTSYGYLRTVEGPGRIVQAASGAGVELEANYPVLTGDLLEVDPGGRLEVSLPDFNVVRLAGGSELLLERLALSAETQDDRTILELRRGELQLLVLDLLPVGERPRVDTANATVYLQSTGVYRLATDGYGWTELVVRDGFAEVVTEAGASVVRGGEQAWIEGERWPRVGVERAGLYDELERWGARLDGEPAGYGRGEVDSHLAYAAAPLEQHGSWVWVEGSRAWRPRVHLSWRPYEVGWWYDSPVGAVWVSHEPWAWVTYHYGTWVPTPHYGWVWYPGRQFAPAWVYWYWGPRYVAWVPAGYYTGYYGHYRSGFRFGVYGWAGGSWNYFADWTFCDRGYFGRRDVGRHYARGGHLARETRTLALERGLITTDSGPEPRALSTRQALARAIDRPGRDELPDVTAFVARRRELPREVTERVFSNRAATTRGEAWEMPRRPRPITAGPDSPRALTRDAPSARPISPRSITPRTDSPGAITPRTTPPGSGSPRVITPRGEAPTGRVVVPRSGLPTDDERWRRESGQLRHLPSLPSGDERGPTAVRPEAVAPGERGVSRFPGREALPAAPSDTRRGLPVPRRDLPSPTDERSSIVRRIWEGIRARQAVPPPAAREGAPGQQAPPAARDGAPSRQPPPDARPAPSPRPPSASDRRAAPPPRSSSSSSARGSDPPRQSSASRGGEGSSRSSARSSGRSNRSSGDSGRSARRRPPD